jgi:hypothetical protein
MLRSKKSFEAKNTSSDDSSPESYRYFFVRRKISGKTSLANYPDEELSDEEFSALTKKYW